MLFAGNRRRLVMRRVVRARVSSHAIQRWQQRVDTHASFPAARSALGEFLASGRARPTPRSWMREVVSAPGLRFVYSARWPGICVLVRDGVAVTVLTRAMVRRSRGFDAELGQRRGRRLERQVPWRWDDVTSLGEAA
jgi:hypothetical protein